MSQPPADYGYGAAPQAQRPTDTMAILGLVFAFLVPILGLIFSIIGRRNTLRDGTNGHGLATAGLWVSIAFIVIGLLVGVFYVVALGALMGTSTSP